MISPVPPQRWLNFSTSQGNPGPHKDVPLKHWPGLNLAGCCALRHRCSLIHPVQPQQGRGGPTEICSSLSLLRACRGVQPFCTSRQSPRQAEGSMGQQHLDQLNWSVWTRVFMASVLNLIIQQLSSGTNLSTCIVGGERSFYKNTGTSEYKIVLPLPSQHYSHLQLKRNVYLLSSVIYIYLVKICYLTDFHIQPGRKKISYTHLLRENTEARNMISLLTSADIIST